MFTSRCTLWRVAGSPDAQVASVDHRRRDFSFHTIHRCWKCPIFDRIATPFDRPPCSALAGACSRHCATAVEDVAVAREAEQAKQAAQES
jgi:hypothetical protein